MAISLEFSPNPNYLMVKISGIWTTNDILNVIEAIKVEADNRAVKRILLNLQELSFPDSEMTRFYSGEKIAQIFGFVYKIAGYSQPEKITGFAETVAVNRFAHFKMFNCETDAVAWLVR